MSSEKPCDKKVQDVVEADTWREYLMEDCRLSNSSQPMSMTQLLNQDWLGGSLSESAGMTGNVQCGPAGRVHEVPNLNEVGHGMDEGTMVGQNVQVAEATISGDGDEMNMLVSDVTGE